MTTKELIQTYYERLNQKDASWQDLWTEDGFFGDASGILNARGKEAVVASFTPFLKGVVSVSVKQIIVDGDTACAVAGYVYANQKGETLTQNVAEVWKVSDGKLKKLIIYFDLTAYRTFMKP
ncbi:MAG: nuclear transport factor 2 family protein [Ignavibacteriales bacterium]|nr:nuclear transport factor 2 family protein [Ignavibacteriales bacterium]